jgi:hypothetical protein
VEVVVTGDWVSEGELTLVSSGFDGRSFLLVRFYEMMTLASISKNCFSVWDLAF